MGTNIFLLILDNIADFGNILLHPCQYILTYPNIGMIFAPCIGYVIQCRRMLKDKTAEGFSTYVSFILIIANIIRIFWWYSFLIELMTLSNYLIQSRYLERFSYIILVASILMIVC
jgi:hypothetical protein